MTRRIRTRAHIEEGVAYLCGACPHMASTVAALEAPVPTRLAKSGFEPLLRSIISQQVSVASAAAIWARLQDAVVPLTPETLLRKRQTTLQKAGLSRPKVRYARALATALGTGDLNLLRLPRMADEDAIAYLCEVPGIGRWTAEIYLMFSLGRPDIFPMGDIALQNTWAMVAGLEKRPASREMEEIAQRWSPYRAVAARVLWTYLRQQRMAKQVKNSETYP